jgi:hypothetical protein
MNGILRNGSPYLPSQPPITTDIIRLNREARNSNTKNTGLGSKKVPMAIPVRSALNP